MDRFFVSIGFALLPIIIEVAMLYLYERRYQSIAFSREVDRSFFRFFTLWRFRLVSIVHMISLGLFLGLFTWLVW